MIGMSFLLSQSFVAYRAEESRNPNDAFIFMTSAPTRADILHRGDAIRASISGAEADRLR